MSIEKGDLKRLVHDELHIDEFESKLGENKDVCVVSFKVAGKEPSQDICSFVEKGYEWVLDADVSPGEMDDGDYLVFIELPRDNELAAHVMEMMEDLMNLTDQKLTDWRLKYRHEPGEHSLDEESINGMVPNNPREYMNKFGKNEQEDIHVELDKLKAVAGVKVDTKAPKNEYTESLRIAAGIL
jgi:hypothetical protein